ncbi:diguanylate cyclase domain-containing protein [Aquimonas sp.]|jgi:diguanylate cyclase (GGDEF)-like protein|uniref:sensor domain-containing diguanylate cyclase n=1 Tax=Aquimonas sp. TaxID=1872588 RepID=UPI0037BFD009
MLGIRSIPLWLALVMPFVALLSLAAGVIGMSSHHHARVAGDRLAQAYADEIGLRIERQVHGHLQSVARLTDANQAAVLDGRLPMDDPRAAAPRLMTQLEQMPHVTFVTYALADGRYIAAVRPPDQRPPKIAINFHEAPFQLTAHPLQADGSLGERIEGPLAYDPRQRPFMQSVLESAAPRWGSTSRYVGFDSLGLSLSAPVRDAAGELLAVVAVGLALEHIHEFVAGLELPDRGIGFLAESDGVLLAASGVGTVTYGASGSTERSTLFNQGSAALTAFAPHLHNDDPHQRGVLEFGQERHLFSLRRIAGPHGLQWLVGVALPEGAFIEPIVRGSRQVLWVLLATVLAVAVIGGSLARLVSGPVVSISRGAASGDLEGLARPSNRSSHIREIHLLKQRLAQLAAQLLELISSLERRVAERTAELSAANEQLEQLSRVDALTGTANRRGFDQALDDAWRNAARRSTPVALLLCDLDHFKRFNDHYGHPAGDQALREVGHLLKACARRPGDLAARYGGEEFALILPDTDEAGARAVATELQQSLHARTLRRNDIEGVDRLSISIGLVSLVPGAGLDTALLIQRADAQLYAAKAAGRNRIMPAAPDA